MLNLPGAKGRAVSSAGTPSQALEPPEQRRQAGEWEPALPAPGTAAVPAARKEPCKLPGASPLPARWVRTPLWPGSVLPWVLSCTLGQAGIFLRSGGREGVSRREEAPG